MSGGQGDEAMNRDAGSSGGGAHVDELLDAFRSGELEATERARVEEHLTGCARCREELAATGAWSDAFDRAYAARRAAAAELEPDWAAQRAAIVARTSARASGRRTPFWRWAPQIALAAVAALIVGIVWRENPRENPADTASRASERMVVDSAVQESPGGLAEGLESTSGDAPPAREGGEREDVAQGRTPDAAARAREMPAAPPPPAAREERLEEDGADDFAKARDEDAVLHEAVPEAAVGAAQAALPPLQRFQLEARQALAERDKTAARRALALWGDTLAPRGDTLGQRPDRAGQPAALADSLRDLLEPPVRPDSLPGDAE
jgi:hypothetical protein